MADAFENMQASLEKQIADLKIEMAQISKSLASRAASARDEADEIYESSKGRVRAAAEQVRGQAHVAADMARENPLTTSAVLVGTGLLGLIAGYVLAGSAGRDGHRH